MISERPISERCGWRTRDTPSITISGQTCRLDMLPSKRASTLGTITEDPLTEPNESERITCEPEYLHSFEFESPVSRTPSPPSIFRRQVLESSTASLSSTPLKEHNVFGQSISELISPEYSARPLEGGVDHVARMIEEAPEWIPPMCSKDVEGRRTLGPNSMLNDNEFITSIGERDQQVGSASWIRGTSSAGWIRELDQNERILPRAGEERYRLPLLDSVFSPCLSTAPSQAATDTTIGVLE